ncbi:M15 family metallopeptidase [Dokdonia sp.]|uniref:M15 family metallopeptidase n=1 Tax=Dokdonia sp. TaxID=2024995 RepID=UPI003266922E
MKDEKTIKRIALMHPIVRGEVECMYDQMSNALTSPYVKLRFSDTLRTHNRQNELYAKGRSTPGRKVTWVKGGYSYHNYGLAFDIVLLIDKDRNGSFETASWDTVFDGDHDGVSDWLEVAKIASQYGWKWGLINSKGKRYDLPHFQKTFGFKASELKKLPTDGNGYPILKMAS